MAKTNGNGDDTVAAAAAEPAAEASAPEPAPEAPAPSKAFKSADDIKAWVRAELEMAMQGHSVQTRQEKNP